MKDVQAVSVIYHGRKVGTLSMGNRSNCQFEYDLTNDNTLGEHATTINFKGLPTDEDLITVGTNIRISRARCLQIMEEVREGTKELSDYF